MAEVERSPRALCSTGSRAAGEDSIGTAEPVLHWIAVEHDGPWGRNPLDHANLPPAVRARFFGLTERVPQMRVVFIRRDRPRTKGVQLFVGRTREHGSRLWVMHLSAIDAVANLPFEEIFEGSVEPSAEALPSLALVCTHGQHDQCCGLRGYAAYEALARQYELVWQCSHIGGDRFAANVVVLPAGIYYARVEGTDAGEIAAAIREERIVLRHYRGRSCYNRAAQVIETVVRRAYDLTGVGDVRVLEVHASMPSVWVGRAIDRSGLIHTIEVSEGRTAAEGFLTCSAKRQESRRVYRVLRHDTIRP